MGSDVQIDLRHVVELRLRSPFDMGRELPPPDLALPPHPEFPGADTADSAPSLLGRDKPAIGEMVQRE